MHLTNQDIERMVDNSRSDFDLEKRDENLCIHDLFIVGRIQLRGTTIRIRETANSIHTSISNDICEKGFAVIYLDKLYQFGEPYPLRDVTLTVSAVYREKGCIVLLTPLGKANIYSLKQ